MEDVSIPDGQPLPFSLVFWFDKNRVLVSIPDGQPLPFSLQVFAGYTATLQSFNS